MIKEIFVKYNSSQILKLPYKPNTSGNVKSKLIGLKTLNIKSIATLNIMLNSLEVLLKDYCFLLNEIE